jgi:choline dehydrogenase
MSGFHYVVIGAGSAGCVIAARLSEDPSVRVLVLEAGGPDDTILYRRPGMLALVYEVPQLKAKCDWGYRTAPQTHMDGRRMPWTRGKIVGGCSTVNGMLYIRGHRANYDEWRDQGCAGWGYDDVLPLFKRSETHEDGESEFHGGSGPLQVTRQRGVSPVSDAYAQGIAEVCGVPMIDDFNGKSQEGAGTYQMTCKSRLRSSASAAFLHPALDRPNLELVSRATVTRIAIDKGRATRVHYVVDGREHTAHVEGEVVVSAGAIGSPQVLLLSGIGPADQLREHGVPVTLDLPGVGANLHDHLLVPLRFHTTKDTGHRSTAAHFLSGMLADVVFRRGWFGKTFLEGGAFVKANGSEPLPNLQMISIPWAYPEPNDDGPKPGKISRQHSFTMLPGLIYPESRGEVRLASADPFAAPIIDPHYLEEDADMQLLLRAIEIGREVARSQAMSPFVKSEATPGAGVTSEAELRAFVRLYGKTIYHPVGTCKMGIDERAVVDPELRVRGVDNLRVADASIMPKIVGGNTNAPAIMIGEKASDLIRGAGRSGTEAPRR